MYLALAIIGGIFSGINSMISKQIVEEQYNSRSYTLIWNIAGSLVFCPALFLYIPHFKIEDVYGLIILLGLGGCFAVANSLVYKAYCTIELSKASIIRPLQIIVAVLIAGILFGEKLTVLNVSGFILVIISMIIIFYKKRQYKGVNDGTIYIVLAYIIAGITTIITKAVLNSTLPIFFVAFLNYFFQIPFILTKKTIIEAELIFKKFWNKILIVTCIIPISWGFYIMALKNANVSIIEPTSQAVIISTQMLLGIIVLKESKNINKKILGLILAITGVVLLNMKI